MGSSVLAGQLDGGSMKLGSQLHSIRSLRTYHTFTYAYASANACQRHAYIPHAPDVRVRGWSHTCLRNTCHYCRVHGLFTYAHLCTRAAAIVIMHRRSVHVRTHYQVWSHACAEPPTCACVIRQCHNISDTAYFCHLNAVPMHSLPLYHAHAATGNAEIK
jgi:hypothetical protein